jgi:hypothetical protein
VSSDEGLNEYADSQQIASHLDIIYRGLDDCLTMHCRCRRIALIFLAYSATTIETHLPLEERI